MTDKRTVMALLYDFDHTLCPKGMQEYTFIPKIGMSPEAFWSEAGKQAKTQKMDLVLSYLYLMLKKANNANQPIRREDFVALGKDLNFFPGVEDWFSRINRLGEEMELKIEHYIISGGLREIIEGSNIYKYFKEVFACEFLYDINGAACWPKNAVNYTTKTQFLFRINKGVLDISNDDDLNKYTPEDARPVPFSNMIYIGDGLTDVPCMRLVKINGGHSIAVYRDGEKKSTVDDLLRNNRVDFLAPADYSEKSELDGLVRDILGKISMADNLKQRNKKQLEEIKK